MVDLEEEVEDFEALAELERASGSSEDDAAEEEDEVSKQRSLLTWTSKSVAFLILYLNKPLTASPSFQWKQGDTTAKRLLGDTYHFCPVALKKHNILWPCLDEIAAKYREKTFYFSSLEARDSFLQNPAHFVAQTEPLKVPADMRRERKSDCKTKQ